MKKKLNISVVVPIFNEALSIKSLHSEIVNICNKENYNYEIIFIDDGSTDDTDTVLKTLQPLKYLQFRKNFGQTAAMDAGIKEAKHDFIITMDGDGQNDPADIPKMIEYLLNNNLDVVSGWRKNRKDSFSKKFISKGANLLRHFLINDNINDSGCSLKVYKKECFETLSLYGEMHRFIPALLKIKGFKIGEIVVNHRPRLKGTTKYGITRTFKGFIDILSVWFWNKYAVRPLHLLGGIGLLSIFLGLSASLYTIYYFLTKGDLSNTVWPLLSAFLLFTGVQFFISGLIADMLSKSYYETTRDCAYNIKGNNKNV